MLVLVRRHPSFSAAETLAVVPVLALTACLSVFQLGRKSFWLDEAFSVDIAGSSWGHLWDVVVHHEANMSLYYVVLHPWLALGDDEATVRLLSVFFALTAVVLVYLLGSLLFSRLNGLVAALLLGANPYFLEWARNGRGYTLAIVAVTASTFLFCRALQEPTWGRWLAYSLVSGLAAYTHFFALLVLLAHALSLYWVPARRRALAALAGAGVLASPLIAFVLTRDSGQIDWLPKPPPLAFVGVLFDFAGDSAAFLLLPVIAALAVFGTRSLRHGCSSPWRFPLLVAWLVAPALISLAVSFVKPIFFSRYLIVSLPAFVLIVAAGVLAPRGRLLPVSLVAAIVAAYLVQTSALYADGGRHTQDWRGATEYVLARSRSADAILFYRPYVATAFDHYAERSHRAAARPHPLVRYSGYGFTSSGPRLERPVRTSKHRRIWLVLSDNRSNRAETRRIRRLLQSRYDRLERRRFEKVVVELYTRSA